MNLTDLPAPNAFLNGTSAVLLLFALTTAARGLSAQYERHVRIARWTLPLWMYVSVTGVVIYLMLYQFF
jgi:uncharacterized membrane protein YozB (DUF420 family)